MQTAIPPFRPTEQPPAWRWISERGLRLDTGDSTLSRHAALVGHGFAEVEDVIPGDGSLLLVLRRGATLSEGLRAALSASLADAPALGGTVHEIGVDYGGTAGPDLAALAEQLGLTAAALVEAHRSAEYTVAFLGFQPGFPYLTGLPRALQVPRRATPRVQVAAGTVALGGAYTGIYPASGPGGWHLIGRTAARLFEPGRASPALLAPGDRVRFVPA